MLKMVLDPTHEFQALRELSGYHANGDYRGLHKPDSRPNYVNIAHLLSDWKVTISKGMTYGSNLGLGEINYGIKKSPIYQESGVSLPSTFLDQAKKAYGGLASLVSGGSDYLSGSNILNLYR